jgi:DNA polymerase-3 subunit epsilon
MRQLIIDTETTGLYPLQGHKIIEIAALEVVNRRITGNNFHTRLDPEREIDERASEIHGMTWEDLKGQPKFADIAAEFVEFARGAQWVIHNAPFDIAFLDRELEIAGLPTTAGIHGGVIDTLARAREMFPGKRNSLDALCERFGISNAHRTLHGALLDAELLAEAWLAMTRGQDTLTIDIAGPGAGAGLDADAAALHGAQRGALRVIAPTPEEVAAHRDYLAALDKESKGKCVWLALEAPQPAADPA